MPSSVELRSPGWACFRPPLDRWIVVCADAAFHPSEDRYTAKGWRTEHAGAALDGTGRPLISGGTRGRRSSEPQARTAAR
jgi:hypothetical protein